MSSEMSLCMITAQERPERKLVYLPSKKGEDDFSYCEEMGCEWEGLLNSVAEKFDTASLMKLPDFLVEAGYTKAAAGQNRMKMRKISVKQLKVFSQRQVNINRRLMDINLHTILLQTSISVLLQVQALRLRFRSLN